MNLMSNRTIGKSSIQLNVVVIGGSSGIGAAIVERFAEAGHKVLTTFFSNGMGITEIKKKHPQLIDFCFLDQGELESIEQFAIYASEWLKGISLERKKERRKEDNSFENNQSNDKEMNIEENDDEGEHMEEKVDVLINNAALGSATVIKYVDRKLSRNNSIPLTPLRRRAMEDEALLRVNSLGPLWITDALAEMMRGPHYVDPTLSPDFDHSMRPAHSFDRTKGDLHRDYSTIIFMGSVGGSTAVFPEYRASDLMSKAAVTYLSKHLAAEHAQSHIDVICLSPGATLTDMFRKSTLESCSDPQLFMSLMPKQRLIEPSEIAEAAFVLSTEKWARIFHGGVLDASLGLGVRPGLQTEISVDRLFYGSSR
eukprot:TRINITY_DN13789_c0_g1_i3.p1 TRINITY_DN13789_c0_g1~~TRINITY_DN13789_c0_g1_i3.p1  ORF type:complete len:368 (-),score=101.65 TRINITY_DN13789_c0_g1_i3:156-1259(-)